MEYRLHYNTPSTFSTIKCKVLNISRKIKSHIRPYVLDGNPLEVVTDRMDLGILVTNNLSWSKHVEWMTTKGNRTLGLVRRMCRHTVSLDVKKVLYCTLVRSRWEYACELWSPYTIKEKCDEWKDLTPLAKLRVDVSDDELTACHKVIIPADSDLFEFC